MSLKNCISKNGCVAQRHCLTVCFLLAIHVALPEYSSPSPQVYSYAQEPFGDRPEPVASPEVQPPEGTEVNPEGPAKQPGEGDKPPGTEKKPGDPKDKDAAKGKDEAPKNVQRKTEPPEPPNPDELKVRPDADGMVQFQFRNQPWPDLLKWLAEVCHVSLDWQELPGDYLNIATQRPYTLAEARDAINRHLLLRGFTMLESEGVISVVKVASINPAMVPRVQPTDLADQPPHRFVRTSFELSILVAANVHEEFKSMLSPNGKITPLAATNRLEMMDAAANLLDVHRVIDDEQSTKALSDLAREFPLKHARAVFVKDQLELFLGLKKPPSSGNSRGGGDMMEMVQQQMQQMQQQMQQGQGGGQNKKQPAKEEIYLVANERNNSVIVSAPQNKMAIVAAFITRMDVPNDQAKDFERVGIRTKVFRLVSLAPAELVKSLIAMDVLEPSTRLQVDETNNAIIAYASIADQYVIQKLIERLDGSQRNASVIQLRRLEAEAVAGTLKFLMGAEDENKEDNNRNRYSYFDFYGGGRSQSQKKTDKMRIGANVQDNQLLVWANEIEMKEVQSLLVKMGELPPPGGRASTMRVIDASKQPATYDYLMKLKEQWEKVSPNSLVLPDEEAFRVPEEEKSKERPKDKEKNKNEMKSKAKPGEVTRSTNVGDNESKLTSVVTDDPPTGNEDARAGELAQKTSIEEPATNGATAEKGSTGGDQETSGATRRSVSATETSATIPPKILIQIDESGKLILQSTDPAALDRLEEMMMINKPPQRPYDVFKIKYARASWVKLNLDDYFKKEKKQDVNNRDRYYAWIFDIPLNEKKEESRQLGKKAEIRFIADNDTNSIVVIGADDLDRRTIKELIELWDVEEPVSGKDVRYTKLVRIKHSKAEAIVETIKEAYKDLLSSNDSAFQQRNQGGGGGGRGNQENKRNAPEETVQADGGLSSNFKGELSLGADKITNSILVSARGEPLLQLVCEMIETLDVAAQPQGNVEVFKLTPGMAQGKLGDAVRSMLGQQIERTKNGNGNNGKPNRGQGNNNGQPDFSDN